MLILLIIKWLAVITPESNGEIAQERVNFMFRRYFPQKEEITPENIIFANSGVISLFSGKSSQLSVNCRCQENINFVNSVVLSPFSREITPEYWNLLAFCRYFLRCYFRTPIKLLQRWLMVHFFNISHLWSDFKIDISRNKLNLAHYSKANDCVSAMSNLTFNLIM